MTAMGSPSNVSLIQNFTGRRGMDSAASTAMTTPVAFTANGARKDSTGRERETAVYPATVTPKALLALAVTTLDGAAVSQV